MIDVERRITSGLCQRGVLQSELPAATLDVAKRLRAVLDVRTQQGRGFLNHHDERYIIRIVADNVRRARRKTFSVTTRVPFEHALM
jgi:hypothetical protein